MRPTNALTPEPIVSTQLLRAEHVRATAALLAHALDDDPAYAYLMPDPARRERGLSDFFAGNLHAHLRYDCTHVALDSAGQPTATVTLRPPDGVHLTPSGHRLRERAPAVQRRVLEASGLTAAEMETLRALARRIGAPADPDAADRAGADSTGTRTTTTDTQE